MFDPMIQAPSLLDAVAEQLRVPLLRIQQLSADPGSADEISIESASLLRLLDNIHYVCGLTLDQTELHLEPVNLSVLCEEAANSTAQAVSLKGYLLEVYTGSKQPILANRQSLIRALESMILGVADMSPYAKSRHLTIDARGRSSRSRLGVYSEGLPLSAADYTKLKKLFGKSSRPFSKHSTNSALHLFVADQLIARTGSRLKTSIHLGERGFAAYFQPSSQLSLVTV